MRVLDDREPLTLGEVRQLAEHDAHVLVLVRVELQVDRGADWVDQDHPRARLAHVPVEFGQVGRERDLAVEHVDVQLVQAVEVAAERLEARADHLRGRVLVADDRGRRRRLG